MKNYRWACGLFAIASLFSQSGMADPAAACRQLQSNFLRHLEAVAETMNSVSSDVGSVSACEKIAEQEYAQFFPDSEKRVEAYLGRYKLSGTEEEFQIAEKILGKKPTPRATDAGKDCSTVLCALEQAFGSKESALRALVIGKRDGYIVSLDKAKYADPYGVEQVWKPEEIRSIDEAFSVIPDSFRRLKYMQDLYRLADGYRLEGTSKDSGAAAQSAGLTLLGNKVISVSSGLIVFFESAFEVEAVEADNRPRKAALHELCHHFDFQGSYKQGEVMFSERPKYGFSEIGWRRSGTSWDPIPEAAFVSQYSKKSPREDFAESCMSYMLFPAVLKEKAPQKYDFLKQKVFEGKEYLPNPPFSENPPEPLMKKLSDENFCSLAFYECLPESRIFPNGFGVQSSVTVKNGVMRTNYNIYATINQLVSQNSCFKKARDRAVQELVALSGKDPAFCTMSAGRLHREVVKACEVKLPDLIRSLGAE